MEFNSTFIRSIHNIFSSYDGNLSGDQLIKELSLEHNNVFNRYLVTNIGGDELEIPIIAREHIEQIISNNMGLFFGELSVQTITLPLYENSLPQQRRTFDSFINQFFIHTDYGRRLQKITSNKGEVYYGGKGLIFDDKYNPLMLCTLKARRVLVDNIPKIVYFKPIVYVNPIVFIEPDKLINKGIIKKVIPYYIVRSVSLPVSRYISFYNEPVNNMDNDKAAIIIDSLDRFFIKPTVPKPQSCINESLNECLVNNIDDVLAMI